VSKTAESLTTSIRLLIQETVANAFSDATIREFLNIVLDDVWDVVEQGAIDKGWLLERSDAYTLTAEDDEYDYPDGFVNIHAVALYDGTHWHTLKPLDATKYQEGLTACDMPTHYTLLKDSYLLTPPPRTTRASAQRVIGTKEPTGFTASSSTSGLPAKCDRVLVLGAARLILKTEGSPLYRGWEDEYLTALSKLPSKLDRRHQEALDPEDDAAPAATYPGWNEPN